MKTMTQFAVLVLSLTLLPMCGGSGGDGARLSTSASSTTDSSQGGTSSSTGGSTATSSVLNIRLTDKPTTDVKKVYVTVASVRVHQSADAAETDSGWSELKVTATMPVDLLTLTGGVLYDLCQTKLSTGHYQQIRLVLTANTGTGSTYNESVVTADGTTHPIDVPSGTIKIAGSFTVEASKTTDLTLDFDASQSVRQRGNGDWFMQPVIKATSTSAASGSTTTS